jgi:predicted nucleotidyltransferase
MPRRKMQREKFSINKRKVIGFCKKHHIVFLALFGSVLTAHFSSKSDIDILVKFEKKHTPSLFDLVDMEEELSSIVGRKVDLKTPEDLSRYFRDEVVASAKPIYVK